MTSEALGALDTIVDPDLREIALVMTNLYTIRLALEQCPAFPYIKNIVDANDVAIMAIESKLELYFTTRSK